MHWTLWLLSPGKTGNAFRAFIFAYHKSLFISYGGVFFVCIVLPMLFLSFKTTSYRDRLKTGQDVLPDTWRGRLRLRRLSLRQSGVHFTPLQKIDKTLESTHLILLGSTGAGKTQSMQKLLKDLIARKDKCLILDSKGDYTSWLCDPSDTILLSPGDHRTPVWQAGLDIRKPDIDLIVQALIEEDKHMAPEWHLAARAAMRAVLLLTQEHRPAFTFHDLDQSLSPDIVREAARRYDPKLYATLKNPDSETARGVLFVLNSLSQGLSEITPAHTTGRRTFSLNGWLTDTNQTRLILKRHPSQAFTFRLTARLLLGVLQGLVMTLPEDRSRRIWLIMDELSVLRKFPPLVDFLERGRSKGLCVVAGIQDWGTMEQFYEAEARTLYTCFVNKFFLSMREPVSAEYYSKSLGESTFERTTTTANRNNVFAVMPALSTQVQTQTRPTISASDLLQIPPPNPKQKKIHGYSQISGYPLAKISFSVEPMPRKFPEFIPDGVPAAGGTQNSSGGPSDALGASGQSTTRAKSGTAGHAKTAKKDLPDEARSDEVPASFVGVVPVFSAENQVGDLRVIHESTQDLSVGETPKKSKTTDFAEENDLQYTKTTLSDRFHPKETPGDDLKPIESVAKGLGKLLVGGMSALPVGDLIEATEVVEDVVKSRKIPSAKELAAKKKKEVAEKPTQHKVKP